MGSLYKAETIVRWEFQFCSEILQPSSPIQYVNVFSSENCSGKRLLRHKEPVIIIPYYINTREEELVKQMLENYNPELVSTITKFEDIVL